MDRVDLATAPEHQIGVAPVDRTEGFYRITCDGFPGVGYYRSVPNRIDPLTLDHHWDILYVRSVGSMKCAAFTTAHYHDGECPAWFVAGDKLP